MAAPSAHPGVRRPSAPGPPFVATLPGAPLQKPAHRHPAGTLKTLSTINQQPRGPQRATIDANLRLRLSANLRAHHDPRITPSNTQICVYTQPNRQICVSVQPQHANLRLNQPIPANLRPHSTPLHRIGKFASLHHRTRKFAPNRSLYDKTGYPERPKRNTLPRNTLQLVIKPLLNPTPATRWQIT